MSVDGIKKAKQTYYKNNKEKILKRQRDSRRGLLLWVHEIKRSSGCLYCGETHPAALQFHHRDPAEKDDGIAKMVASHRKRESILLEISKCDIVCANCHAKLHWNELSEG